MNNIAAIQEELKRMGLDAVLITDEKNQRYAVGFPFTDGAVLVSRKKAWLITDSRYVEAAEKAAGDFAEICLFHMGRNLTDWLRELIEKNNIKRLGAEEEKLSWARYRFYRHRLGMELEPAQQIFTRLRSSKNAEELKYMREAQAISERALEETLPLIRPGVSEREIAAELVYRMLKYGSEGNSFDPIVICGKKTSMPHGVPGDELIKEGDFVTMDFGSIKGGYCSDMTRTVAVGSAGDEMRNVYDIVLKAQLTAIKKARAGIRGCDIDKTARDVIAGAGYGEYFGHGFGHSLGLDIHEWPAASPSCRDIMPAGAVVSAEPGIYIPGKFGVRIEDVLILREGGCEDITKAPKELIILKNS
ncbi:MAG: M24 family metallopeptidase [Candidatus Limivicinus sp.]|jgi:Xaa-Pro aminopeptidase